MRRVLAHDKSKGRTIRAVENNLKPGEGIQAADKLFYFFQRQLRDYYLSDERCPNNENSA